MKTIKGYSKDTGTTVSIGIIPTNEIEVKFELMFAIDRTETLYRYYGDEIPEDAYNNLHKIGMIEWYFNAIYLLCSED